ncbi:annexin [Thraustotheca clavata]|uniref:Annexin n=1 Tax=Thraustotheca clavata TaxID=74557 RepID=A0A1V9ZVX8_9STRA|nr:annexin [Thraustotheca clavata]
MAWLTPKERYIWGLRARRLCAMTAAIIAFIIEYRGSIAVQQTLLGASHWTPKAGQYTSQLILQFAVNLSRNQTITAKRVYIDNDNSSLITSSYACNHPLPADKIYSDNYLNLLLPNIFAASPHFSWLQNQIIIVDCTYTGRMLQDTTALNLHFLDNNQTMLTTLFLQTIQINRIAKRLSSACGMATISTMNLSAILIGNTSSSPVITSQIASYSHVVGIDFPYVIPTFDLISIPKPTKLTATGFWQATIVATNEQVELGGTEGIYRSSKDELGSYNICIWDLPLNPLQFLTTVQYMTTDVSKDSYAWIRALLGMGISLNLVTNFGVSLLVSIQMYLDHGAIWIPDLFPSVQFRIQLRALFCFIVSWSSNWWHVFEYALNNADARDGWTNTFVLNDIIRADALMMYLALAISLTKVIRIRLRLEVTIAIYLISYAYSDAIITRIGIGLKESTAFVKSNYLANILQAHSNGMDLWVIHAIDSVNFTLLITQFTWWFLACGLCVTYALFAKAWNMYDPRTRTFKTWQHLHHQVLHSLDVAPRVKGPALKLMRGATIVPSDITSRRLTHHSFSGKNLEHATFEQLVHARLCETYGIIAALDEYHIIQDVTYVSPSSIWLLGYVLLGEQYIIDIDDVPALFFNKLINYPWFRVIINYADMNIYPQQTHEVDAGHTLHYSSPIIDNWCNEIRAACAGIGTDEDKLSQALGTKTASERYLISLRYPELHGKSLLDEVVGETSRDYGKLLQLLAQPIEEAEAMIIRDSTKGAGTAEKHLIPVLSGRSNEELNILKKAFFKKYESDMVVVLDDDLGGDLKKFYLAIVNQMAQTFDPEIHNQAKATEIADTIYKAGEGKWGTDEATFCNALCSIPPQFMPAVNAAYAAKQGHSLERAIEKEFSGKARDALVFHVGMNLHPIETIAAEFEKTMHGFGTDEYGLSAALVRYQHLLPQLKQAYKAKFGKILRDRIHGETSGDYRKLLLTILDNSD